MANTNLHGKVVLVTGAGSGLGEATSRAFARAGANVACVDVNKSAAERVSTELRAQDVDAISFGCDVSDADAVTQTVNAVAERWGRLDVVVNCAAIDYTKSVAEMSVREWDQVLAVNLRGPFLLAKAAMAEMRRVGEGGHIVNIASTAATRAWANAAAYHASKWGLVGFGRGLGVEGRPDHIKVTTVIPGGMQTHFFDKFPELGIPMPDQANLQDPANVAATIVFAVQMPPESVMQEVMVTPLTETSWP